MPLKPLASLTLLLAGWLAAASNAEAAPLRTVADFAGSSGLGQLGGAVAAAGDLNGDGIQDFAVGEPGWGPVVSDSTGRVLIYFGGRREFGAPDLVLTGNGRGSQFGYAIAALGDVDGDGFGDLLVTAPTYVYPNLLTQGSGRAYLFRGAPHPDSIPWKVYDAPVVTQSPSCRGFGFGAVGIGDANGDGYPDWVITFDHSTTLALGGGALLYLGGPTPPARYSALMPNPASGRPTIFAIGDVDGDHRPDLGMGVPDNLGVNSFFFIFTSIAGSLVSSPWAQGQGGGKGLGTSMAAIGDLNGDGLADFLISQPRSTGGGSVYIYYGNTHHSSNVTAIPISQSVVDSFGVSIAAGHMEGDSSLDVAVGACGEDSAGINGGAVYVYRLDKNLLVSPLGAIHGSAADYLGTRIAIPGDVDGNGTAELLVGAPLHNTDLASAGRAQLLSLSARTLLEPAGVEEWSAGSTATVRWAGSAPTRISLSLDDGITWQTVLDNAGGGAENTALIPIPDVVCSRARVRLGPVSGALTPLNTDFSPYSHSITRPAAGYAVASRVERVVRAGDPAGRLGAAIAAGFDLDGDGRADAALGAPYADGVTSNAGAVEVVWGGGGAPRLLQGEAGGDLFGSSLSMGADVDGDGLADLLVGAPSNASGGAGAGAVYLFTHAASAPAAWKSAGTQVGEALGTAVQILRDWDGDARPDLAASAPYYRGAAPAGGGRVLIWSGATLGHAAPPIQLGAPPGTIEFGRAIASLDLNGDGSSDLAVSARDAQGRAGVVFVYLGGPAADRQPDLVLHGDFESDDFGYSLADAGDLNGDGVHELAIGAPGANGGTGRVLIVLGGSRPGPFAARVIDGAHPGERFGAAIAGVGDLNGDGRDDLVVGAPGLAGECRLYLGGETLQLAASWLDDSPGGQLGSALARGVALEDPGAPAVLAGAPVRTTAAGVAAGGISALTAPRYIFETPADGATWFSGASESVRWQGAEPAQLGISTDSGRTWLMREATVGGEAENLASLVVPGVETDSALIRLTPVQAGAGPSVLDPVFVKVRQGGTLSWFRYTLADDGVHLSWSAQPGTGPHGWAAYRLYRSESGGAFQVISPPGLVESTFVAREHRRGLTYELRAVNGLGEEQTLGRVTVPAPVAALRAWPVPSDDRHPIQLAVDPPVDAAGRTPADFAVRIYDVHGRWVRGLAGGSLGTRVGELQLVWDRQGLSGSAVEPGVYFVRAEIPSTGWREERRVVVLK